MKEKISKIYKTTYVGTVPTSPTEVESAFKGKVKTFRIKGSSKMDYKTFLQLNKMSTVTLLNNQAKPIKIRLLLYCQFYKVVDDEKIFTDSHFSTKNEIITESTDLSEIYNIANERLTELLENFQKNGSGWIFDRVLHFEIMINTFKPLRGSSYIELPKSFSKKKAIINPKNYDNECFKWCVGEAVYPQKVHRERITKKSRENAELFDWSGMEFPANLKQINVFEKNNEKYAVNVLGYEDRMTGVFPLRISKHNSQRIVVNLLLISYELNQHYLIIQDLSRLLSKQVSKHKEKTHICLNCMNPFPSEESLKKHKEYCDSHEMVKIEMPKKKDNEELCIKFEGLERKLKVPFVMYADFESLTEKFEDPKKTYQDDISYTRKYQKHVPSGFCFYIVYRGGLYKEPVVYSGQNVVEEFCKRVEKETQEIYDKYLKKSQRKPLRMTHADKKRYRETDVCHICDETIEDNKVRDHDHLTGKFRGAAHSLCNISYTEPNFVPVVFHNLSGYDSHLFVKQLGVSEGRSRRYSK